MASRGYSDLGLGISQYLSVLWIQVNAVPAPEEIPSRQERQMDKQRRHLKKSVDKLWTIF